LFVCSVVDQGTGGQRIATRDTRNLSSGKFLADDDGVLGRPAVLATVLLRPISAGVAAGEQSRRPSVQKLVLLLVLSAPHACPVTDRGRVLGDKSTHFRPERLETP
jgi:hypothetical protein